MAVEPTVLDLFCGAGGLSCGLEMTGFRVVGGVEADARACQTFLDNHPRADAFRGPVDVRELTARTVWDATGLEPGGLDVLVGGPPCQGFSMAGYRRTDDARNALVFEFSRLLDELAPAAFVMENVVGLASMTVDGRTKILRVLADEFDRLGYSTNIPEDEADWGSLIVDAADMGVPQHRRRVLILGARAGRDVPVFPGRTHAEAATSHRDSSLEPHVTVREALFGLPAPSFEESVPVAAAARGSSFAHLIRSPEGITFNHAPTRHAPWMVERMASQPRGTALYDTWAHAWYRLVPEEPAPTVKENHNAPFVHPDEPRVVTPRECARLQSFPDGFRFCGPKSRVLVQIGNAVPPLLGRRIGAALMASLRPRSPSVSDGRRPRRRHAVQRALLGP